NVGWGIDSRSRNPTALSTSLLNSTTALCGHNGPRLASRVSRVSTGSFWSPGDRILVRSVRQMHIGSGQDTAKVERVKI
ncbi:uncharacterized protein METZ01_LOCUS129416, partial [marine metagenome]